MRLRHHSRPNPPMQKMMAWQSCPQPPQDILVCFQHTIDSGYSQIIGSSSASSILQSISAMLPHSGSPGSQDSRRTPGSIRVKSVSAPDPKTNAYLAKAAVTGRLIDAYFLFYNSSYPILHERTFRERFEKHGKIKPASSYTAILHMVLAIGNWVLGEEGPDSPYYGAARSWLSAQALESGTLGAVQAFLLMVSSCESQVSARLTAIGELSAKARSPQYRLQYHWNSLQNGTGIGYAS